MKRTGRLRPVSAKRASERGARAAVVKAAAARDGGRCVARYSVPEVRCAGPMDGDEYDLRSARPGGHLDVDNVQTICRAHHDWKHREPIEAAHRGLRPYPITYTGPRTGDSSPDSGPTPT